MEVCIYREDSTSRFRFDYRCKLFYPQMMGIQSGPMKILHLQ
jgi:hypothetical protein